MRKLVSIVTPCYNGEKYIDRYAKSLLSQTYDNCQLIFMDDGSTDKSKEKIFSYKEKFIKKGFSFEYHYHENIGVGATISEGVKYIKGDYFIWPDIDDTLTSDSIEKKVNYLENYPTYGVVRTDFAKIHDDVPEKIIEYGAQKYPNRWKEDLFEDYLLSNQAWVQPGCFMIRMTAFLDANPLMYIYPTRRGQNWQILLPVLYKYKCGYIDEPLYCYYIHSGSLSDSLSESINEKIKKYDLYEELIVNTLENIEISKIEKEQYKIKVTIFYLKQKIDVCFNYGKRKEAIKYHKELRKLGIKDSKYRVKVGITGTFLGDFYIKLIRRH